MRAPISSGLPGRSGGSPDGERDSAIDQLQQCCFGCMFRHVARATDTPTEAFRKRRAIVTGFFFVAISLTALVLSAGRTVPPYSIAGLALVVVPSIAQIAYVLRTKTAPLLLLEGVAYCLTLGLLCHDMSTRRRGNPPLWPFAVVILDMCLVNQLPARATRTSLGVMCVWIVAAQFFNVTQEWGPGDEVLVPRVCDCESPPCGIPVAVGATYASLDLFIVLVDFYLTRGFASKLLAEKQTTQATINTVQQIALHLSEYDLQSVADLLESNAVQLPAEMGTALRALERNLRLYRPYLPDALFEQLHQSDQWERVVPVASPPGIRTREATIIFTDIRASTSIWEAAPEAMKKAMRVHNTHVRAIMDEWAGYEVKTVGDSFMVAFDTAVAGVNFGLRVHEGLLAASWPANLLRIPICARHSVWGGLTVRIGMNSGTVTPEENALTKRVDYFGHTVNIAARLESICEPGAVALRSDLWESISGSCAPSVSGAPTAVSLKGVQAPVAVTCVWPHSLRRRQAFPLPAWEPLLDRLDLESATDSDSSTLQALRLQSLAVNRMRPAHATIGVVQQHLPAGGVVTDTASLLSSGLEELANALERSKGTLVGVLGVYATVGWNLARRLEAHAESSLQFVHLLQRCEAQYAVGLATGRLEHGDIGTRTQRFVTVVGKAVRDSWALCDAAERYDIPCLFTASGEGEGGEALHTALRKQLSPTDVATTAYELPQQVYELRHERRTITGTLPPEPPPGGPR